MYYHYLQLPGNYQVTDLIISKIKKQMVKLTRYDTKNRDILNKVA